MALTNPCFKDQFGLKLGRTRREERRGEEEEEEEEEKRKRKEEDSSQDQASQGMDAWILVWNYMVLYGFLVQIYICGLWVVGNLTLE